ncbi:hypothetical protein HCN44_010180 [Aphidius gifuensis]|uniref:Peptidase M13 C-terminal domain-containing protein n=1 Tax=Aphidius gifuensis TaxID=684658 RepID=A0A834XUA5_APHGI|nr:hypothetical protein HCN44_010180 [Aphidius gifuensis]
MGPINGRVGQDPTDVLHNMKYNIGYPDWYLNLTHVNTVDEKFNLQFDYFESYLAYNKYQMKRTFGLLSDTTDGNIYLSEWSSESILNANAYYDIHQNLMILPVGLLRFPFFHIDLPPVFVYSQVGVILAHEMSHAFTSRNSKEQFFIDDSQCFYKQYEKYEIIKNSINEPIYINENETLDENVADNLGLDLSYDLYKQMKKEGKIKELKIPGLQDFTDDQLFFLGFANTFCGDETRKHLLNPLAKTDHPPYKWRVNGAISNTKGFSKAFSCPPDAPMNPVNKCSIWR